MQQDQRASLMRGFIAAIRASEERRLSGRPYLASVPPSEPPTCPDCGHPAEWITGRWYCFARCGRFIERT